MQGIYKQYVSEPGEIHNISIPDWSKSDFIGVTESNTVADVAGVVYSR